jgi:hypothetical protein
MVYRFTLAQLSPSQGLEVTKGQVEMETDETISIVYTVDTTVDSVADHTKILGIPVDRVEVDTVEGLTGGVLFTCKRYPNYGRMQKQFYNLC